MDNLLMVSARFRLPLSAPRDTAWLPLPLCLDEAVASVQELRD